MQEIEWKEGRPVQEGLYFVAVQMGPAAGCFDFATWNGSSWEKNVQGDVVAHCDAGSFVQQISVKWPFADNIERDTFPQSSHDSDFEEV